MSLHYTSLLLMLRQKIVFCRVDDNASATKMSRTLNGFFFHTQCCNTIWEWKKRKWNRVSAGECKWVADEGEMENGSFMNAWMRKCEK